MLSWIPLGTGIFEVLLSRMRMKSSSQLDKQGGSWLIKIWDAFVQDCVITYKQVVTHHRKVYIFVSLFDKKILLNCDVTVL